MIKPTIIDISADMPKSRVSRRNPSRVYRAYVHHSGVHGADGRRGAYNSARFFLRKFSRLHYHYWIPVEPDVEDGDGPVVYQLASSPYNFQYHTQGKPNVHGVGIALQGNTSKEGLSENQHIALWGLLYHLKEAVLSEPKDGKVDWLSWHSDSGRFGGSNPKRTCPGRNAEEWLRAFKATDAYLASTLKP